EPGLFSEHLAWSTHGSHYLDDLLPVPYTNEALAHVCEHIDTVQAHLNRQMLLENPATYLRFQESTWTETDFIQEIARRTGCGLLLDVNNVHVACTNQLWNSDQYIRDFPVCHVQQIHLAGHARQSDDKGRPLLIDSHDARVDDVVWGLFEQVVKRTGPTPTLIEWDANIPQWSELEAEAQKADLLMGVAAMQGRRYGTLG
ncbi:MAG: DUF692 domain-containing protein, partial [Steroidobacteraceae bacterium]